MKRIKVLLYEDATNSDDKRNKLEFFLSLKERNVEIYNLIDFEPDKENDYSVYFLTTLTNKEQICATLSTMFRFNFDLIDIGPCFSTLGKKENRDLLLEKVNELFPIYVENEKPKELTPPENEIVQKEETVDLGKKRDLNITSIKDLDIEQAITAISFMRDKRILVSLPEIKSYIGPESMENCLTYEEAIAMLMFFKRLGSKTVKWKNKEIYKEEE